MCSELRISLAQLDNSAWFLLTLAENRLAGLLTITENELAIDEKNLKTSSSAHIH
jgi:hypothetical protein